MVHWPKSIDFTDSLLQNFKMIKCVLKALQTGKRKVASDSYNVLYKSLKSGADCKEEILNTGELIVQNSVCGTRQMRSYIKQHQLDLNSLSGIQIHQG